MSTEKQDSFFSENEKSTNRILSKALLLSLLIYPFLVAGLYFGAFLDKEIFGVSIFAGALVIVALGNYLLCTKKAEIRFIKYFCLIVFEFAVFYLSTFKSFGLSLSYVLPILISCLYFNEKFSLAVTVSGFLCMWASLTFRAFHQPEFFTIGQDPLQWLRAFGTGFSIEYLLCSMFMYYLAKTARISFSKTMLRKCRIQRMGSQIIQGFANIVESKDSTTGEHIMRTGEYVRLIGSKMMGKKYYPKDITPYKLDLMVQAAPFHDLGKLSVPDVILNKPGKLTPDEFSVIHHHPYEGATFIQNNLIGLENPELIEMACNMALCHHERLDGTGYPFRLINDEIPVCARIMSAADILDALLMKRPYKEPFTIDKALGIMQDMAGKALDPLVIEVLQESKQEIAEICGTNCSDAEDVLELVEELDTDGTEFGDTNDK